MHRQKSEEALLHVLFWISLWIIKKEIMPYKLIGNHITQMLFNKRINSKCILMT